MKKFLLLFIAAAIMVSCGKTEDDARVVVRLTDSPGDYEKVNIDLTGVQVHRETGNMESGWISLDVNAGVYDLLTLTDGVETVIADSRIPAGEISQLRLVLGNNNSVVVDGEEFHLKTPSAMQSGLKLQVHETLLEGVTYSLLLDFDAAKSIVITGNQQYILKPVIKTVTEARSGAVQGTVLPAELNVAIFAMNGEDTVGTTYVAADMSEYLLGGLEPGNYDLVFDPGDSTDYQLDTLKNVEVILGEVTVAGETILKKD